MNLKESSLQIDSDMQNTLLLIILTQKNDKYWSGDFIRYYKKEKNYLILISFD